MSKETELCLGCMEKIGSEKECPRCGYCKGDGHIASYLAPGIMLNGRYLIGRLICYNGESGLYIGYDMAEERKVTVREYMPETLCARKENSSEIEVYSDHLPLYKTYLAEYIELHRTLMTSDLSGSIQPVLNVFTGNNTAYAVMDYIEGIGLKTYLSSCGDVLSWEQVKHLFAPILTTLGMLHSKGIIHRGLCPNTLLVTEKKELRIIGFGISASRTADSDIACEVFSGYAAPEQYSSARRNGSWTDIYGISAVLYRCLTGKTPQSAQERLENDTLVEPSLVNHAIPSNVSKVIMKGLSLEVSDRISNINEFVDRLFEQPQPVVDSSAEIRVPTHRTASNARPTQSGKSTPSRPAQSNNRKSGKKRDSSMKYIIICCAMGVAIVIFLLVILISAATGGNSVEEVTTTLTEAVEVTNTESDLTEATTEESEQTTTTAKTDLYVLPDFKGRKFDSISEDGRYSYLTLVPTYEFNNDYESGMIFEQDIESGTTVGSGTTINLKVSKGAAKVALPDYANMTVESYKELLGKLNIKYETKMEETDKVKEGYVSRCSVEVGTEIDVANGETVVVYTALTPAPTEASATEPSSEATTPVAPEANSEQDFR